VLRCSKQDQSNINPARRDSAARAKKGKAFHGAEQSLRLGEQKKDVSGVTQELQK